MKKHLHLSVMVFLVLLTYQSYSQTTLISNNTNLQTGFVLPNGKPVLEDEDGYLWTTDGTTATKITATVINVDSGSALYNNQLYFSGKDVATNDVELWVTDGTAGGTKLVKNIAAAGSSVPKDFFVLNNSLYFTANDGINGRELWISNGSVGNGTLVANINSGAASAFNDDAELFQNGNLVLFKATSGGVTGLWKIDLSGTPTLVKNIDGEIQISASIYAAALGSKVVFTVITGDMFTGSTQLWVTDGTGNNTIMLKDFGEGTGFLFPQPVLFKGLLYFDGAAATSVPFQTDTELWTTDGTPDNTKLFKDIQPGKGASNPVLAGSAIINDKLYFNATTDASGSELWYTDGTSGNTKILLDINPNTKSSDPSFLIDLGAIYGAIGNGNFNDFNLQKAYSTAFKGKLYFTADDGTHGTELWSTDGSAGGTHLVKDINLNKGDGVASSFVSFYSTTGIYFVGNDGNTGDEPWITDGTDAGTKIVADINTAAKKGSDPEYAFLYNKQLYFSADNGDNSTNLTDLYKINQEVVLLPVNLLSFTAALQQQSVLLNWTTATEINTNRFAVERSTDGVHFNEVGTINASGGSHSYLYNDATALQAGATVLYYRLKSVDNDGSFKYSATLPVNIQGGIFKITLSPNPVHNQLTVTFSIGNAKNTTLRITDASGKQVYQKSYGSVNISAMQQAINVAPFANGTYFVQLISDKETKRATFVKQ